MWHEAREVAARRAKLTAAKVCQRVVVFHPFGKHRMEGKGGREDGRKKRM